MLFGCRTAVLHCATWCDDTVRLRRVAVWGLLVATDKVFSRARQIREPVVVQGIPRSVSQSFSWGGLGCRLVQKAHVSFSGYAGGRGGSGTSGGSSSGGGGRNGGSGTGSSGTASSSVVKSASVVESSSVVDSDGGTMVVDDASDVSGVSLPSLPEYEYEYCISL